MNVNTIGSRIKNLRIKKGATQAEVANALNVKRQTVDQWESGARDLKTQYTISLADYFNVTSDYILRGIEAKNIDIYKKTSLNNEAINMLEWLSMDKPMPEGLQEIELKFDNLHRMKVLTEDLKIDLETLISMGFRFPENITDDELEIYKEYLQIITNKNNIDMINCLLSSINGIEVINCIYQRMAANNANDITIYERAGADRVYKKEQQIAMCECMILSAVNKLCENL